MTTIQKMQALQDAHAILSRINIQNATGTMSVWMLMKHAQAHLDVQMRTLLF